MSVTASAPVRIGRPPAKPFGLEEARDIRRRYEAGETIFQISRAMQTNTHRVREALLRAGGTIRPLDAWPTRRSKVSEADTRRMVERFIRGDSKRKIARDFDVSPATVTHHLKKGNIA